MRYLGDRFADEERHLTPALHPRHLDHTYRYKNLKRFSA